MPAISESSVQHGNHHYLHDAPPQEDVASSSSNQLLLRLAKMPSGDDPISAAFLSTVLGCCDDGEGDGQRITGFCVDQGSVVEGRHSTTFRLLLDREDRKGGVGSTTTSVTDSSGNGATSTAAVPESVTSPISTSIDTRTRSSTTIRSVFVKRMTCRELPARSLSKWRCSGRMNQWAT